MTVINRRKLCQLLAAGIVLPQLSFTSAAAASGKQALFASAAKAAENDYRLYVVATDGRLLLDHKLPTRAHHVEAHPHRPLLACTARRPDRFIDIVDYQQGKLLKRIESSKGRHFFGHSVFTPDGEFLISSENNIADGQGRIVIRRAAGMFTKVADMPSGGIGPHEIKLLPADSKTLMIANGGILTHPDQGRKKLNLDSMQPSLAALNILTGKLDEQQLLPVEHHQLSIRHIDTNLRNETIIALQYQGKEDNPPLVAIHRKGQALKLLSAPEPVDIAMKRYCGSARFDSSGQFAAISSPRGNLITFWDLHSDSYHSMISSPDGCGLAATRNDGEFIISTGRGVCQQHNLLSGETRRVSLAHRLAWDNHMVTL
ncbi:DUF1513 domain-containing protein [Aliamphritea ceti]|uniref:DUF1513 domain-containing protein n=1 Tax=Aliamphritea ceti TaxID=1524258 RepID=UPI0021C31221|nr:DUF1513 domain-containing protein [Aliamphritea ceti]